ncbi:MAG: hypothetical protein ACRDT4_23485 [Micromonosporaceae bacterium]
MTIGDQSAARTRDERRLPRTPVGALAGLAMLAAPVLVTVGGLIGRAGWLTVGLGWLGVGLLVAAALTVHSLRSSFEDEIAEQTSLAVRLGEHRTRWLYYGLVAAAYLVLGGLVLRAPWTAIALVTVLLLGFPVWQVRSGAVSGQLNPVVRDTALVSLHYGALVGLALALSG